MKLLFKKYLLNPAILGICHISKAGRIDFEEISEETLEILHSQGLLEGHVTLVEPISDSATEDKPTIVATTKVKVAK